MPRTARCPVCNELVHYDKYTGKFVRHRDPRAKNYRLCAGSQRTMPVPRTANAKAASPPRPQKARPKTPAAPVDPRQRCPNCFKLLLPRADGCFRVHTVADGVRCEGSGLPVAESNFISGRRPKRPYRSAERDFEDLSFKELIEAASIAAELEAEQAAETALVEQMKVERDEARRLEESVNGICEIPMPPEEIRKQLNAEASKWLQRETLWQRRITVLEGRCEVDPESWETELKAARKALKRCEQSCRYIYSRSAELARRGDASRPAGGDTRSKSENAPKTNRSNAARLWSAVSRLWR